MGVARFRPALHQRQFMTAGGRRRGLILTDPQLLTVWANVNRSDLDLRFYENKMHYSCSAPD
jgi:hypothetical protein